MKARLNGRRDAEVTEVMASSKSHLGSMGAHRNRGAFLDLSLCAKEQFLHSQDRRAPQRKGDATGQSQRIWAMSEALGTFQNHCSKAARTCVNVSQHAGYTLLKGNILLQRQKRWSFTLESAWNSQADTTQFHRA